MDKFFKWNQPLLQKTMQSNLEYDLDISNPVSLIPPESKRRPRIRTKGENKNSKKKLNKKLRGRVPRRHVHASRIRANGPWRPSPRSPFYLPPSPLPLTTRSTFSDPPMPHMPRATRRRYIYFLPECLARSAGNWSTPSLATLPTLYTLKPYKKSYYRLRVCRC